jgi:cobalamin biosynthesis protein CobT
MERIEGLLTALIGLYDSVDTRLGVYIDSLGGAYDRIKRLERKQRRMDKRLALLEEGLIKKSEQEKDGEQKGEKEKGEEEKGGEEKAGEEKGEEEKGEEEEDEEEKGEEV